MFPLLLLLIFNIIKTDSAISVKEGEYLFRQISEGIKSKLPVVVDFSGITFITTCFLTSAIGELYTVFSEEEIDGYLKIENLEEGYHDLLEMVIKRSKEFHANPEEFEDLANEIIYGS